MSGSVIPIRQPFVKAELVERLNHVGRLRTVEVIENLEPLHVTTAEHPCGWIAG